MAADSSFDISSEINIPELENSINNAMREIENRYDFKGTNSVIEFKSKEKEILFDASDEYKIKALYDVLIGKCVKRAIDGRFFEPGVIEGSGMGRSKQTIKLKTGIEREKAKEIIDVIKGAKLKVQSQITDNQIRVSSKSKDELQAVMALIKKTDFKIPLQFGNYR